MFNHSCIWGKTFNAHHQYFILNYTNLFHGSDFSLTTHVFWSQLYNGQSQYFTDILLNVIYNYTELVTGSPDAIFIVSWHLELFL